MKKVFLVLFLLAFSFFLVLIPRQSFARRLSSDPIQFQVIGQFPQKSFVENSLSLIPNKFLNRGKKHTWFVEPVTLQQWNSLDPRWSIPVDEPNQQLFIVGLTFTTCSKVFVRNISTLDSFRLTVIHEAGHCIWEDRLSSKDRELFGHLWVEDWSEGTLVTPYAETSIQEGFSEAFSYWVVDPHKFHAEHLLQAEYFEKFIK